MKKNKYHVTYFYHASGMELGPDTDDYGIVEADSEDDAKNIIAKQEYPKDKMYGPNNSWSTRNFFKGCLSAKLISNGKE